MKTLNYIGCKKSLIPKLTKVMEENIDDMSSKTFCDIFAGTGTVAFNMLDKFDTVVANDMESYSATISQALIQCEYSDKLKQRITLMNAADPHKGLMYKHYSNNKGDEIDVNKQCDRLFFTTSNAKKMDGIRVLLDHWLAIEDVTENEYNFLLSSLIVSVDKIANTSCVYGAYLKTLKKSAAASLVVVPIHQRRNIHNINRNRVYNLDANKLVEELKDVDVVYADPPYNQRQYSSNYTPLNILCDYCSESVIYGKTGLVKGYNKSAFSSKTNVQTAFNNFVKRMRHVKMLILSYNDEGIMTMCYIKKILLERGDVVLYKFRYPKFKSNKNVKRKWIQELIWVSTIKRGGGKFKEVEVCE